MVQSELFDSPDRLEDLGDLACAVFDRVAQAKEDASGLFSAAALAAYAGAIGRDVSADQVQRIGQLLQDYNLIVRKGYGVYGVTDPFVQQAWRERNGGWAAMKQKAL